MDEYNNEAIPLSTGLDFSTNKLMAAKGSLQDCLNREIIDSVGYKRIDGIDKYDGQVSPSMDDYFILRDSGYAGTVTADFVAGDLLVVKNTTNIFGKVLTSRVVSGTSEIVYARINKDYEPVADDLVVVLGDANDFTCEGGIVSGSSEEATAVDALDSINTYSATLRADITDLHDTPIGLHYYRDRLFSVVTDRTMHFEFGGTTEIKPNYYIKGNYTNTIGRVLSVDTDGGTWAGGDATGMIQYELISGTEFSTDAPPNDSYARHVVAVLNWDGSPGSTTFTDESVLAATWSAAGNAVLASDATFGTVASFDGTGDAIQRAAELQVPASVDWTLELWFKPGETASTNPSYDKMQILVNSGSQVYVESLRYFSSALSERALFGARGSQSVLGEIDVDLSAGVWYKVQLINDAAAGTLKAYLSVAGAAMTEKYSGASKSLRLQDLGMRNTTSTPNNEFLGSLGPFRVTVAANRSAEASLEEFPIGEFNEEYPSGFNSDIVHSTHATLSVDGSTLTALNTGTWSMARSSFPIVKGSAIYKITIRDSDALRHVMFGAANGDIDYRTTTGTFGGMVDSGGYLPYSGAGSGTYSLYYVGDDTGSGAAAVSSAAPVVVGSIPLVYYMEITVSDADPTNTDVRIWTIPDYGPEEITFTVQGGSVPWFAAVAVRGSGGVIGEATLELISVNDVSITDLIGLGETISYNTTSNFNSPLSSNIATAKASSTLVPQYASLWQSRNEQQAYDESSTVGWDRIDHGWEIDFTNGLSDTDSFVTITRSDANNFDYASGNEAATLAESYNGNNVVGSTLATFSHIAFTSQKVLSGDSGWKTNASATAWATGDEITSAVSSADANYAYANLWYYTASTGASSGFPAGYLTAFDKQINGPVSTFGGQSSPSTISDGAGTETFDSDFWTTQARAPIILRGMESAASAIPEGSLISGIEVIVSYSSQHYMQFSLEADQHGTNADDAVRRIINLCKDNIVWEAAVVETSSTTQSTLLGEVVNTPIAINETAAQYPSSIVSDTYTDAGSAAKTLTGQTATLGGNGNTFGISGTQRSDFLNPNRCIALYAQVSGSNSYEGGLNNYASSGTTRFDETIYGVVRLKIDRIQLKLYYTEPSARYYVGDGAGNVCSVDVMYYVQSDGEFANGTAEGKIQFTNIEANVAGTKQYVEATDTLHLDAASATAGTSAVATVSTDAIYNGLPSISRINDAGSRYQMITHNFFGRDEWDGFYGVNGADRAFSYASYDSDGDTVDEYYVTRIYTNTNDIDGDTPRHITEYSNCLGLGYGYGIFRASVPGEPENFSGEFGASEIGVGDGIVGLQNLKGTALGIFCNNSVRMLVGSDPDQWQLQTVSADSGIIEYSLADCGFPVFCTPSGISTLEQTERYGSFLGKRLSANISPWIVKRMTSSGGVLSAGTGNGVACAIPVRNKNQYLLFFKDGLVLCTTLDPSGTALHTYRRYLLGHTGATADALLLAPAQAKFVLPAAFSAQADEFGRQRVFISHYSTNSTVDSTYKDFVYELDKGWGFAGGYIPEYYTINWWHANPFANTILRKLRIDGLNYGVSSSQFVTSNDYGTVFSSSPVDISLDNSSDALVQDYVPASKINSTAERGRSVAVKVSGKYLDGVTDVNSPVPSDIHQIMLLQFLKGGRPDA